MCVLFFLLFLARREAFFDCQIRLFSCFTCDDIKRIESKGRARVGLSPKDPRMMIMRIAEKRFISSMHVFFLFRMLNQPSSFASGSILVPSSPTNSHTDSDSSSFYSISDNEEDDDDSYGEEELFSYNDLYLCIPILIPLISKMLGRYGKFRHG